MDAYLHSSDCTLNCKARNQSSSEVPPRSRGCALVTPMVRGASFYLSTTWVCYCTCGRTRKFLNYGELRLLETTCQLVLSTDFCYRVSNPGPDAHSIFTLVIKVQRLHTKSAKRDTHVEPIYRQSLIPHPYGKFTTTVEGAGRAPDVNLYRTLPFSVDIVN